MGKLTKQKVPVLVARLTEFQEEFIKHLSSEDGQFVIQNTKKAIGLMAEGIKGREAKSSSKDTIYLHYLKTIKVKASDGTRMIYKSPEVFKSYLDINFKKWGLTEVPNATTQTAVDMYELYKDAISKKFILSLNRPLESLILTDNQIIDICLDNHIDLRKDGHANLFLIKKDKKKVATEDNVFVVLVGVGADGLRVYVNGFSDGSGWNGSYLHRFFVPATEPLEV